MNLGIPTAATTISASQINFSKFFVFELFDTYFDNIVLQTSNSFINNNVYETTDPNLSLKYSNNIDFNKEVKNSLESLSKSLSQESVTKVGKTTL